MALMLLAAAAIYFALGDRQDAVVMLLALVPVLGVDLFLEARSRSASPRAPGSSAMAGAGGASRLRRCLAAQPHAAGPSRLRLWSRPTAWPPERHWSWAGGRAPGP